MPVRATVSALRNNEVLASELTEIHNVIPADGAVVHHDIPGPQGDGIPL